MGSLLQRAIEIRNRLRSMGVVATEDDEDLKDISAEERQEIMEQINEVINRNRIRIDDRTFLFKTQKSGALLPILINFFAVTVLAGGILLFLFLFNQSESAIVQETETVESAEGRLVKALKEESERQISEKEAEIAQIQLELEDAEREQERLRAETESKIQARELELRQALKAELEAERKRLTELGYSEEVIQQRLKEFEEQKRREYNSQLAELRSELEAEQAELERQLGAQIADIQESLTRAQADREQLEEDYNRRAAELQEEFAARETELASERAEILAQLESIGQQQQQEKLVVDQILSMYDKTNGYLQKAEYDMALATLDTLENYLQQPSVENLPSIQRRNSIETFIIQSMRRLIRNEQALSSQEQDSATAEELLASVSSLVEEGNRLFEEGDVEAARDVYLQAMARIPVLESGYGRLKDIEDLSVERERETLSTILAEGNELYRSEDYQGSVERYREALGYLENDTIDVDTMVQQIIDAGYRLRISADRFQMTREDRELLDRSRLMEQEREQLLGQLEDIKDEYARASAGTEGVSSQETLVALLNTKLLIKQVLASESIRSEHPALYEEMDEVFEAYGEEKRKEGRDAALKDLVAVTEYLTEAPAGDRPVSETLKNLAGKQDLLLQFFDNLENLLDLQS